MASDVSQLATLFLFFVAMGLCLWRAPRADQRHVILCGIAAALWCDILLFEPRTPISGYAFIVVTFLITALAPAYRRRAGNTIPR
ncbi:MAG TPA: hypothetical protein VK504_02100 [Vicinamibacterales bacterium]|jgi:hypothetical protein|nr:hypothetical protein [Vicinamibacterales bacterium]